MGDALPAHRKRVGGILVPGGDVLDAREFGVGHVDCSSGEFILAVFQSAAATWLFEVRTLKWGLPRNSFLSSARAALRARIVMLARLIKPKSASGQADRGSSGRSSCLAMRGYAVLVCDPRRTSSGRSAVVAEKVFELLEVYGDALSASGSQVVNLKVEDGLRANVVDAELIAQSLSGFLRG
jgi:hypothetical protein